MNYISPLIIFWQSIIIDEKLVEVKCCVILLKQDKKNEKKN